MLELPQILMAAGLAVMIGILLLNIRRRAGGRSAPLSARERLERARQTTGMRDDLRQMMVELEELTRRFSSQLDAKTIQLEQLLDEADRRIGQLQRLQGGDGFANGSEDAVSQQSSKSVEGDEMPGRPADPMAEKIYEMADEGAGPADIANQLNEHVGKVELILALRQA